MSHKSLLQELCQKNKWRLPDYKCRREGPDYNPRFTAAVHVNEVNYRGSESSTTKKDEHEAARVALVCLNSPAAAATPPVSQNSLLQELYQQNKLSWPKYDWNKGGPDHDPIFSASVFVDKFTFFSPNYSTSVKSAGNEAAKSALDYFNDHPIIPILNAGGATVWVNCLLL